jgi:predicted nucleic acid-binding Zn ribbon protein
VSDKKRRPVPISDALTGFLKRSGLEKRIAQASAVEDWPTVVGGKIAAVTRADSVTPDGTLFVSVLTHAWMTELSLLEPELLKALNSAEGRPRVKKIRFQLRR